MTLDCLDNIIGLSPTDCDCYDSTKPVDFNTLNASSSGLYVSQPNTVTLRWTNSASDCENGGLWDLVIQAREQAVRDTLTDFLAQTQEVKSERFLPFTKIGDDYFRQAETVKGTVAGVWLEPYELRGANLIITAVDIAFWSGIAGATPVTIEIYSSLDFTTPLASAVANVTTDKQYATATLSTPLIIDLGTIREDLDERLYFSYTIPVGAVPVKNDTERGCRCNKRSKIVDNPYLQIMCLGGSQSNTVEGLSNNQLSGGGTMNGLVIKAELECDYWSWLCNLAQKPSTSNAISASGKRLRLGMILADTIQAKAVVTLIESIANSSRINIETMVLGVEELKAKHAHFSEIYSDGIDNLVYYMPEEVSDCLKCAEDKRMNKGQILA